MTDEPTIRIRDGSMVTREEYDRMEALAKRAANRQVKSDSSLKYSDLVERLRDDDPATWPPCEEAADAIEALMAALKPFADDAKEYWSDSDETPDGAAVGVDVAWLRAARAAMEQEK